MLCGMRKKWMAWLNEKMWKAYKGDNEIRVYPLIMIGVSEDVRRANGEILKCNKGCQIG